ncbi:MULTISPECIES: alpha/beta fold hydrolase [unclassified Arthrobacter]|uniref:alpha/beta fold hydrolase n=1 Tax=unclassified Arthrobacter TaxID=235627 RepID=UPI001492C017|nr:MULTISPECIES: alpha/beta hydrolase [unclassified Arthrobacter]MBE0009722.1 alpha/beta hydrolase [Arthrobacter sp. AET 35A]NOJ63586.1 alpha/beta hydrolase [Arthrobacter sp. 147(2020)]
MTTTDESMPHLDGVEHRFLDLPGLRMHVAEAGSGDPLLLLHGFPQHWWEWRKVLPALAHHHRVIAPDLRGAGWTDAPASGYHREQLLADLLGLLDALNLEKVSLLTHDWSSLVAYQLCLQHPDRVRKHLALSIPPPFFDFDRRLVAAILRGAPYNLVVPLPFVGPQLLGKRDQALVRYLLLQYSGEGAFTPEDLDIFAGRFTDPARARAGSALYRRFIQPEGVRALKGTYRSTLLTTDTRVLLGAKDTVMSAELVHGYEAYASDVTLEVVDHAAHFIVDDRPDVVRDQALAYFGDQRAA